MKMDRRSEFRSACALRWLRVARCSRALTSRSRASDSFIIAVSALKAWTTWFMLTDQRASKTSRYLASIFRWNCMSDHGLSKKTSDCNSVSEAVHGAADHHVALRDL